MQQIKRKHAIMRTTCYLWLKQNLLFVGWNPLPVTSRLSWRHHRPVVDNAASAAVPCKSPRNPHYDLPRTLQSSFASRWPWLHCRRSRRSKSRRGIAPAPRSFDPCFARLRDTPSSDDEDKMGELQYVPVLCKKKKRRRASLIQGLRSALFLSI